jgi:hypothetical protein
VPTQPIIAIVRQKSIGTHKVSAALGGLMGGLLPLGPPHDVKTTALIGTNTTAEAAPTSPPVLHGQHE